MSFFLCLSDALRVLWKHVVWPWWCSSLLCTGATNKELPGMWHRCEAALTFKGRSHMLGTALFALKADALLVDASACPPWQEGAQRASRPRRGLARRW